VPKADFSKGTKVCSHCKIEKELVQFNKDSNKSDGLHSRCKVCKPRQVLSEETKAKRQEYRRQWRAKNREKEIAQQKRDAIKKKEKGYKKRSELSIERQEKAREVARLSYHRRKSDPRNKQYRKQVSCVRKQRLKASSPKWLTVEQKSEIMRIYESCRTMTEFHEELYHVDHIEPLIGKTSCGLHVPWNLQILKAEENQTKGNKLNSNN